jgi:hypothetical protein
MDHRHQRRPPAQHRWMPPEYKQPIAAALVSAVNEVLCIAAISSALAL